MKKLIGIAIVGMLSISGCALNEKIQQVREVKYAADTAFVEQARKLLVVADEGWHKKHELQLLIIQRTFTDWARANGAQFDAAGNITGGTVGWELITATLKNKQAMEQKLAESEQSWATAKKLVSDSIDAYERSNTATYATEQEAYEAQRSAQAALTAALEAIGAFGGGMLVGAAL